MRSGPLVLLARLAKQELERLRQDLTTRERELAAARAGLEALERGLGAELALAWALPDGARLAGAYNGGMGPRRAELQARILASRGRRDEALAAVTEQAHELERISILVERAQGLERSAAARAEIAFLDELGAVRHGLGDATVGLRTRGPASPAARPGPRET